VKLPGDLTLEYAHSIAEELEEAVRRAVPEINGVQTHLEPLEEEISGHEVDADEEVVSRVVRDVTGSDPRALRFVRTDAGLVAYLTLGLSATSRLDDAHARASEIEERIRRERPDIADVVVHTEP
jgi:divalent metal cation (Fe/Co/Zn/Cd) transporter